MPKYRAHLFPIMRVVYEVQARTPRQAIQEAEVEIDYADDPNTEAIVDRVGPIACEVFRDQFYRLVPVKPRRQSRSRQRTVAAGNGTTIPAVSCNGS